MPNFIWLLQCVEDKMDVSQDFTDNPRIHVFFYFLQLIFQMIKFSASSYIFSEISYQNAK